MMIILFLVIISAGFTIMGTLVMVVMEKRKAVGILKSMGAKPNSIMVIFVLEGFFIGIIGSFMGVICGIATALNLDAIIRWVENAINAVMEGIYALFNLGLFNKIKPGAQPRVLHRGDPDRGEPGAGGVHRHHRRVPLHRGGHIPGLERVAAAAGGDHTV